MFGKKYTLVSNQRAPSDVRRDLIAVQKASMLLAEHKNITQELLKQLRLPDSAPQEEINDVTELLERFAEFVQLLPESRSGFYSEKGGGLQYALERTEHALKLTQTHLAEQKEALDETTKQLWLYTIFSSVLLYNIGLMAVDIEVELYDRGGRKLPGIWDPLDKDMLHLSGVRHYTYTVDSHDSEQLHQKLTILLARQLMPAPGFTKIRKNPAMFSVWLALLVGDTDGSGGFKAVLSRALALALKQRLASSAARKRFSRADAAAQKNGFSLDIFTLDQLDSAQLAELFVKWMEKALAEGKIAHNKDVYRLTDGQISLSESVYTERDSMVVTEEAVRQFIEENRVRMNTDQVLTGLQQRGIISGDLKAFTAPNGANVQGAIMVNPYLALPENIVTSNLPIAGVLSSAPATGASAHNPFA